MNIDAAASQTHLAHLASARAIVLASQRGSTSLVQRTLKIQYSEAAALLEELECDGVVGPMQFPGGREVLLQRNGRPKSSGPGTMAPKDIAVFNAAVDRLAADDRTRTVVQISPEEAAWLEKPPAVPGQPWPAALTVRPMDQVEVAHFKKLYNEAAQGGQPSFKGDLTLKSGNGGAVFGGDHTFYNSYYLAAPWIPTAEAVNALPDPLRKYIRDLETLCDPSGMVRDNAQLRDTVAGLQTMYRNAADALGELVACKDLKDAIDAAPVPDDAAMSEYKRRKDLAWAVARALVLP